MDLSTIGGILLLIADVYAIVMTLQSSATTAKKVIWSLVIILLPLVGLIAWFFAGPGKKPI